jgi:inosose dehydratase
MGSGVFNMSSEANIKLAAAPVSWGVDHMGRPNLPPWPIVFDQIAEAGFRYTELGPLGYLPENGALIRGQMESRKLQVVGAALLASLGETDRRSATLSEARRLARLVADARGSFLILVDWSPERHATAGRSKDATRLKGQAKREFHSLVSEIGRVCLTEFDLIAAAHPHAGSFLEFEDEIDDLMDATDPASVTLAIDTGHSLYADIDPASLFAKYAKRTSYVNFKDVSGSVLTRARDNALPFLSAVDQGVFCCLGDGAVEFRAFCEELNKAGFRGPAVIEQDRSPETFSSALAEARKAIRFMQQFGIEAQGSASC